MNSIKEDWNSAASAYEVFNNAPDSYSFNIEWPCIRKILPELKGKSVLDLGCGTGIFTFLLEQYSPNQLIGMDLSDEMLSIAKEKASKNNSKAMFIEGDISKVADYIKDPVDFVFSSTTTHYIEDLTGLFMNVNKCIKDGGVCIFSIIHPVYSAIYPIEHGDAFPSDDEWAVRYLDKSMRSYIQPWIEYNDDYDNQLSRSFHHTFADYINAILKAGFQIEEIKEPLPPKEWKETSPNRYDNFIQTPTYMIIKFIKH